MPRRSFEVPVEPGVLIWARETIGLSPADVAKRLNVSEDLVNRWECGERKPTVKTLEKLAVAYKRPLAAFFLPAAPVELPLPSDYRRFPSDTKEPLSPKTRLAIRRARRLQSIAAELAATLNRRGTMTMGGLEASEDPETAANKVREGLRVGIETQLAWRDARHALNSWRDVVEESGVLVSQTAISRERIRAFCLAEPQPPIIVLNSRHSVTGRIFSLFHEYAHILLGSGGICTMEEADEQTEIFCNHFAGAFLVTERDFREHSLTGNLVSSPSFPHDFDDALYQLAKAFKVSREVILRRMLILGLVEKSVYERKRREWEAREWQQEGAGGRGRDMARECIGKNGARFVSLVLEAHRRDRITYSDVADYLGVRTKHFGEIEQLIAQKA